MSLEDEEIEELEEEEEEEEEEDDELGSRQNVVVPQPLSLDAITKELADIVLKINHRLARKHANVCPINYTSELEPMIATTIVEQTQKYLTKKLVEFCEYNKNPIRKVLNIWNVVYSFGNARDWRNAGLDSVELRGYWGFVDHAKSDFKIELTNIIYDIICKHFFRNIVQNEFCFTQEEAAKIKEIINRSMKLETIQIYGPYVKSYIKNHGLVEDVDEDKFYEGLNLLFRPIDMDKKKLPITDSIEELNKTLRKCRM